MSYAQAPQGAYQDPPAAGAYDYATRSAYVEPAGPYTPAMRPPPPGPGPPLHSRAKPPMDPVASLPPPLAPQQHQQQYYDGGYTCPAAEVAGYAAQPPQHQSPLPAAAQTGHYHACSDTFYQSPGPHAAQYAPPRVPGVTSAPGSAYGSPQPPPQPHLYSAAQPASPVYAPSQPVRPPPPLVQSATAPLPGYYSHPPPHSQPQHQAYQQQQQQQPYQQQQCQQQPYQQQPYQQPMYQQPPQQPPSQQLYQPQQLQYHPQGHPEYQQALPAVSGPFSHPQIDAGPLRHGPSPPSLSPHQSPQQQPRPAPYPADPAYDPRRASADMSRLLTSSIYSTQAPSLSSAPLIAPPGARLSPAQPAQPHPGARMSPVQQQQQQQQQYPPVRHSSLREQPVRHSPVQQQQAQMLQRHYSMNHPPDHRDPALPQRLAPTQQLHPGDKSGGYSGPAHSRSSYVPVATTDSFCAPQHAHGLYDQQRAMALQPAMASLANSMGALSLSHQQQQQQQQSQWAPLTVSAVLSQPTLVGSSATMPAPYRGVAPAAVVASSTTLVRSQTSLQQPVADGGGVPMWGRINANAFKAYQHQVTVQKSSLSGTKYALVIGINYYEMEYSQTSNINSAHTMRELLVRKYGYKDKNVVLLSDDQESERWHPTHHNITTAIRRMMREVRPNDAVLVYYCGFGRLPVQVLEKRTEVLSAIRRLRSDYILPSDFETTGAIDTAHLHKTLVHSLPPSARLTVLFNCVVSETGLGVAYKYTSTSGTPVLTNAIAGSNLFEAGMKAGHACTASFGDLSQRLEASLMQQQQQQHTDASAEALNRIRQSSGDIIVFGWDRDYANPKHKQYLSHTPSNQFGHYWAAAMEGAMRTRGATTFADVLGYMQASTGELAMLPFIACGRKISMDEEFVI